MASQASHGWSLLHGTSHARQLIPSINHRGYTMNRIYRLVWNRALHVLQVASELAHSCSGNSAQGEASSPTGPQRALVTACAAALLGLAMTALPIDAAAQSAGGN